MAGPNPGGVSEDGAYHFSFKVAICGDTGVGKTTLLEGENAQSYARTTGDTTVGINFRVKFYEVDGRTYRVQFWDTPSPAPQRSASLATLPSSSISLARLRSGGPGSFRPAFLHGACVPCV